MRITKESKTDLEKIILDHLDANATDALVQKINEGEKTLAGCWNYIIGEAGKQKRHGNCAAIPDATVFGWAFHYFEEDSISETKETPRATVAKAEKPEKKKAEKKPEPKEADRFQLSMFG
jgi:hypothetical protein